MPDIQSETKLKGKCYRITVCTVLWYDEASTAEWTLTMGHITLFWGYSVRLCKFYAMRFQW